jgi:hypothetical protein
MLKALKKRSPDRREILLSARTGACMRGIPRFEATSFIGWRDIVIVEFVNSVNFRVNVLADLVQML